MVVSGEQARHLRWAGAAMLGAGAVLSRLPQGFGLPCPLRASTGIPCPFCGMTTSVKGAIGFDAGSALAASPAGVVLVAVALIVVALRPERIPLPPAGVLAGLMAAMWVFQLNRFGFI